MTTITDDTGIPTLTRERVLEEKRNVTTRISETCRYIGFGLLAIYYAAMIADESSLLAEVWKVNLMAFYLIGVAGVLTVLFDYLQYFVAQFYIEKALSGGQLLYDQNHWSYKGRVWFFWIKQFSALLGVLALLFTAIALGN